MRSTTATTKSEPPIFCSGKKGDGEAKLKEAKKKGDVRKITRGLKSVFAFLLLYPYISLP